MMTSDTARIFDIRRFSTHDGGGIRTTVFFKGCPLQCAWCHNPEGISKRRRPVWFAGKCMGCGSCISETRRGGILRVEGEIIINPDADENWDAVMDECPTGALRWDSRDVSIDELMDEIRRDMPFYAHGGGGVTLSGGDPLLQAGFARELLLRCKNEGVHTAIETELHAPEDIAFGVLECCDLIYADLKLIDSAEHRKYTGAGNELILSNFRKLLTGNLKERVIVRTPLIPGITATQENIAGICVFLRGLYPDVKLELLNYNPLASAKYDLVGREYCFRENPPRYGEDEMQAFREIARRNGIKNILSE